MLNFFKNPIFILILVGIFIGVSLLGHLNLGTPSIDSATFLYIAKEITKGKIPYKDIFDHKVPLVYFIDVAGLLISKHSLFGVWMLEFISLFVSVILSFYLVKKIFGPFPAFLSTLAWLNIFFKLLNGGNLTEEYAIPFQFGGIYLFWLSENKEDKNNNITWIVFGILSALVFFLKQNLIGIFFIICIIEFIKGVRNKKWNHLIKLFRNFFIGNLLVFLPFMLYFIVNDALSDFSNFAFRYNLYYSGKAFSNFFNVVFSGLQLMLFSPLGFLGLLGWFDVVVVLLYGFYRKELKDKKSILFFLLLLLPIEYLLVSTSGKIYTHYYIVWIPAMTLLTGYIIYMIQAYWKKMWFGQKQHRDVILFLVLPVIILWIFWQNLVSFYRGLESIRNLRYQKLEISNFIDHNTSSDDYIFIWGVGSTINFDSNRRSPSRFIYQTPLYIKGFQNPSMYYELLYDLINKTPEYILDGNTQKDKFRPIICNKPFRIEDYHPAMIPLSEIKIVENFICKNYKIIGIIDGYKVLKKI